MNTVDADPEGQSDPDKQDLVIEGIVLPPNSPYRRTRVVEGSSHRREYTFDGMNDDPPNFLDFPDPLDDLDW